MGALLRAKHREKTIGPVPAAHFILPISAPNVAAAQITAHPPNPPKSQFRQTPLSNQGNCIKLGQTHVSLPESVGAPLVGALRGLLWRPNLDAIALFSLPLRGQEGSKMFSVPLRGPPWTKKGFLRAPSRPFADKKGILPAPSRAIVASELRCNCPVLPAPPWTRRV